jgi:hypothetical protein
VRNVEGTSTHGAHGWQVERGGNVIYASMKQKVRAIPFFKI